MQIYFVILYLSDRITLMNRLKIYTERINIDILKDNDTQTRVTLKPMSASYGIPNTKHVT